MGDKHKSSVESQIFWENAVVM